jgi:uncharacterized membrane protein YjjB (DUF3815 family)
LPDAYGFFLLPLAAISFSMMMKASYKQLPGMLICSAVGQFSSYWFDRYKVSSAAASFLCAMLVTTAARLWAWWHNDERPLTYLIAGLIVLVPGGVGVKGALRSTLSGDQRGGLDFTFDMVMIGITLAIGVFVSLVPTTQWFFGKKRRSTHHPVIWTLVSPSLSTGTADDHEQDELWGDSNSSALYSLGKGEGEGEGEGQGQGQGEVEGEGEDEETGLSTPASVTPFQSFAQPQPQTQTQTQTQTHTHKAASGGAVVNPLHSARREGQGLRQGQRQGLGLGQGRRRGADESLSLGEPNSDALLRMLGTRSAAYFPGRAPVPALAAAAAPGSGPGSTGGYTPSGSAGPTRIAPASSFGSSSEVGSVL